MTTPLEITMTYEEMISLIVLFIITVVVVILIISFLWTISRKVRRIKTSYYDIKQKTSILWENNLYLIKLISYFFIILIIIKLGMDIIISKNSFYIDALTAFATITLAIVTYYSVRKANQMAKQTYTSRQGELEVKILPKIKGLAADIDMNNNKFFLFLEYLEGLSDFKIAIFDENGKKIVPSQLPSYIINQSKFIERRLDSRGIEDTLSKEDMCIDFLDYDNEYRNTISVYIPLNLEINVVFVRFAYVTKIHNSIVEIYKFDKEKRESGQGPHSFMYGQIHYKKYSWEDKPWYPLSKYNTFKDYETILDIKKHEEELDIVDQIKDSFREFLSKHKTINRIFNRLKKNKN